MTEQGPWISENGELNAGGDSLVTVNCSANQTIEIDKSYGPLAALGVRVVLEYKSGKSDWVVSRERPKDPKDGGSEMEWVEMARWDCQLEWWEI
jgi:hypothetical protein